MSENSTKIPSPLRDSWAGIESIGIEFVNKYPPQIRVDSTADSQQKIFCLALYIRAVDSFIATRIMLEQGYLIEAATLARSSIENAIHFIALKKDIGMLKTLRMGEAMSQKSTIDLFRLISPGMGFSNDISKDFDKLYQELLKEKRKPVDLLSVAKNAGCLPLYAHFKDLSATAVHPSLSSIARGYVLEQGTITPGVMNLDYETALLKSTIMGAISAMVMAFSEMADYVSLENLDDRLEAHLRAVYTYLH